MTIQSIIEQLPHSLRKSYLKASFKQAANKMKEPERTILLTCGISGKYKLETKILEKFRKNQVKILFSMLEDWKAEIKEHKQLPMI
ncbi:MAG TPA: hypothetical protein VF849_00090 [Blattabacteriaceae bacterium]